MQALAAWQLVILCSFLPLVVAQAVIPYSALDPLAQCQPFSSSNVNCVNEIAPGTLIYVNSSASQAVLDAAATPILQKISAASLLSAACSDLGSVFACATIFPSCVELNVSGTILPLPQATCSALCAEVNSACASVYQATHFAPPPCTPPVIYDLSAIGGSAATSIPCNNGTTNSTTNATSCFRPDFEVYTPQGCVLICPLAIAIWGEARWEAMWIMSFILNWVGFIAAGIFSALHLANPVLRRFPGWLIGGAGVCVSITAFSHTMSSWWGADALQCDPNLVAAGKAQFVLYQIFGPFALTFWLAMVVISFLSAYSRNPQAMLERLRGSQWLVLFLFVIPLTGIIGTFVSTHGEFRAAALLPFWGPADLSIILDWSVSTTLVLFGAGTLLWIATFAKVAPLLLNRHYVGMHAAMIGYELGALISVGAYIIGFLSVYWASLVSFQADLTNYLSGVSDTPPNPAYGAFYVQILGLSIVAPLWALIFGLRYAHWIFLRRIWKKAHAKLVGDKVSTSSEGPDVYRLSAPETSDPPETSDL